MKITLVRRQVIIVLILTLLMSTSQSAQAITDNTPKYNHCNPCLHNATEKKDIDAWGAWAYITYTNPNLNGGLASYHRVGVVQWSPWRFVEFGWRKLTGVGTKGLIAYDSGSGGRNVSVAISGATHRYSMQYDPNNGKYWFYLDGANVYNVLDSCVLT